MTKESSYFFRYARAGPMSRWMAYEGDDDDDGDEDDDDDDGDDDDKALQAWVWRSSRHSSEGEPNENASLPSRYG